MRELKFRAWVGSDNTDRVDEEMHYEYGLCLLDGKYADVSGYGDIYDTYEEVPIEQYTGLKDKNGREIYEGDIVKAKIQGLWETGPDTVYRGKAVWNLEVVYNEIRYMDVFHILGSKNSPDKIYYLFEDKLSELEVIGNIHENPELLVGD